MEFDGDLMKIQGALFCLGTQGLLNSQESVSEVVNVLKDIINEKSEEGKSKITFFMVLNSSWSISEELKNDENVGLLVHITPVIEKHFLIDYLYELNLYTYLCEIVENCPNFLVIELVDVIIEKLKQPSFHKTYYGIQHMYKFWRSVFVKLWKIQNGYHSNNGSKKLLFFFEQLYQLIEKVLITSERFAEECKDLIEYIGKHLFYLLDSILYFVNLKTKGENTEKIEMYEFKIQLNSEYTEVVSNPVDECISIVLRSLPNVLEGLTLDVWLLLSECNDDNGVSYQQAIGECVYLLCEAGKDLNISKDVLSCLSSLKIKPKEESDKIAEASVDHIISNVNSGKKEWFKALVRHSSFSDEKIIDCLKQNISLADDKDINVILDTTLGNIMTNTSGNSDTMKELFLEAVKLTSDCLLWVEKVFKKYQPNILHTSKSQEKLVEVFNKMSNECSIATIDVLSLCMQLPSDTVRKICDVAIYNPKHTSYSIELLKAIKPACVLPLETHNLLDNVLKVILDTELNVKECRSFASLIGKMGQEKLIGAEFCKILCTVIKEKLESEQLEKVLNCLTVLKSLLECRSFTGSKIVLLVFLSQVLDNLSWDLFNFSTAKANAKDLMEDILKLLMKELKENDDAKLEWVRQEVMKTWEVNQAYFCDLWFLFGRKWTGSGKFHSSILAIANSRHCQSLDNSSEKYSSLLTSLCMLLPVLTSRKWTSIFHHLSKSKPIYDVLITFSFPVYVFSLSLNSNKQLYSCFEHCLRSYSRLALRFASELDSESLAQIIQRLLFVVTKIESKETKKQCSVILSPVLLKLIDHLKAKGGAKTFETDIMKALHLFNVADVVEAAKKKLTT